MEVVANEEKKKIFRARKTMKISDRQQLESLHNTLLTAAPGLSERSSPPLMNGTHKEDVPKAEDKEQNNVSGSNSPRAASPSSPASLSSPAPFLSLNLSPSPPSSQSPTSKDDAASSPTSPFHSLNFELKKMEEDGVGEEKKDSLSSTGESVKAPSTESKENEEKDKDVVPEKKKKKEEHTTTDDPASDLTKGTVKGGDSSSSKPSPVPGCTEPMDTDNNTTKTNDSETPKLKEEKPPSSKSTTLCPSSSPPASSSVDPKQEKDIKSEDIKEEEDEKEDKKKESTGEDKMEVESVKVEPKKEKTDIRQTTKPSRPSSTPPSNSAAQEEKGSTSGLKRTLSEGSDKDGPAVKREGKRPKVEREELEAQLELKITANAGSHHKLEKIVQQLVDERLRVLELTIFDNNFKELKDRVDKIDCATKHQTAINTLQAKIARLAKKFGEANQASENKRKTEALAAAAAAAAASKNVTVTTSAQPQRPVRMSMEVKQAQTVSSPSTAVPSKCVQGRDGTVWKASKPVGHPVRQKSQKAQSQSMGPTAHAKSNIKDAGSAFLCLLDMKILEHIRDCTVAEAHRVGEDSTWDLSIAELKAFIALLYARGVYGKNMELESFWSQEWGVSFFRNTMPRDRFRMIMRYLRFDKKQDQRTQLCNDKFGPITDVWSGFVNNSIACYQPGSCITVDEHLFPTNARCYFSQFLKDKQEKYGVKFWVAADAETKYFLNGFPYLGKYDKRPDPHLGESVVLKLMAPFMGKKRTVTTKTFFTSLSLAKYLQQKNTSLVGTIDKLRPELPFSIEERGELFSTKVLKHDKATLTIYQNTDTQSVALLSTMHSTVSLGSGMSRRPETFIFYDKTKAGVEALDQMARRYSVKSPTQRWPIAVFYNILDMAGVNAYILLKECTATSIPRKAFMLQLVKELREELMSSKASLQSIHVEQAHEPGMRKQCQINSHCRKNRTLIACTGCYRPMCGKCTKRVEHLCYTCASLV